TQEDDGSSEHSAVYSIHTEDEEDEHEYQPGGYHPVSFGDQFHQDRYKVVRKLGWGHFSTVWLAHDKEKNMYVALKIVKSAPRFTQSALEEIKLLEKVKETNKEAVGWNHIAQLLDHFWHQGPNGKHVCMTFEVLGESLLSLMKRFNHRGIPSAMVKRITRQLLLGLDYLHRECGIIHTDIKPENVLLWIPNVQSYLGHPSQPSDNQQQVQQSASSASLLNQTSPGSTKSRKRRVKRRIKKQQARATVSLHEECPLPLEPSLVLPSSVLDILLVHPEALDRVVVKLADLGNACWTSGDYGHVIQTRQYRSPEVIVGARWSERADMWSLACMIFELLTGEFLFDPRGGSKFSKDDDHLAQIIELMQVVPRSLTTLGEYSREFFGKNGQLRNIKKLRYRRLRDVLHDSFLLPPSEADLLSHFLSPMLQVEMEKRRAAKAMLDHQWL
ncbi:hypothetical protein PHYBLDRAFT_97704, partial [Phycomyces blakesleeanus NRRL 1555(-)]